MLKMEFGIDKISNKNIVIKKIGFICSTFDINSLIIGRIRCRYIKSTLGEINNCLICEKLGSLIKNLSFNGISYLNDRRCFKNGNNDQKINYLCCIDVQISNKMKMLI